MVRKLIALTCLLAACGTQGTSSPAPNPQVILTNASGEASAVSVEIADTDAERATGLMFRDSLAINAGMLFVYTADSNDAFYMKNTLIALDIIFIASDLKIIKIAAATTPLSLDLITSPAPYRYVLEVRAGYAGAHGLKVGDTVRLMP